MRRRNGFRGKGLRHEKTLCNISLKGWSGEREWGKAFDLAFPVFIWAFLSTDALSDPCSSSGETGIFTASCDIHSSSHYYLLRVNRAPGYPRLLQPCYEEALPGAGFPALLWITGILRTCGFSETSLQITGFNPVSQ